MTFDIVSAMIGVAALMTLRLIVGAVLRYNSLHRRIDVLESSVDRLQKWCAMPMVVGTALSTRSSLANHVKKLEYGAKRL